MFDRALSLAPSAVIARFGYDDYQHFLLRHPRGGALGRAARALAGAGLPEPAPRWRWSRVPPPAALERALGLDEPSYRSHLELSLAHFFDSHGMTALAARHLAAALTAAPNGDAMPDEIRQYDGASLAALYRETYARLRREGRTAEPTKPENRALAGL